MIKKIFMKNYLKMGIVLFEFIIKKIQLFPNPAFYFKTTFV